MIDLDVVGFLMGVCIAGEFEWNWIGRVIGMGRRPITVGSGEEERTEKTKSRTE